MAGLVITTLLVVQAIIGYYHHQRYIIDRPTSHRWFTHLHLWLGRFLILAGGANCGKGLSLATASRAGLIAWYTAFGVLAVLYGIGLVVTRQRANSSKE